MTYLKFYNMDNKLFVWSLSRGSNEGYAYKRLVYFISKGYNVKIAYFQDVKGNNYEIYNYSSIKP